MQNLSSCNQIIESFAQACNQMNDYARHLETLGRFRTVKTQAGIQDYLSGWRLEKWLEAPLNENLGLWACWWLELGFADDAWLIGSNVSISHSDFHLEFPTRSATSVQDFQAALSEALSDLTNALEDNLLFKTEVARHLLQRTL